MEALPDFANVTALAPHREVENGQRQPEERTRRRVDWRPSGRLAGAIAVGLTFGWAIQEPADNEIALVIKVVLGGFTAAGVAYRTMK